MDTFKPPSRLFPDLVFIQLTVLVLLLPLALKRNDDKTHEDVDHEERDDDDVDEVENGHQGAVVVNRTHVLRVRVNRLVHHPVKFMFIYAN